MIYRSIFLGALALAQSPSAVTPSQMTELLKWQTAAGTYCSQNCGSSKDDLNCAATQSALLRFRNLHARGLEGEETARNELRLLAKTLGAAPKASGKISWEAVRTFCEQDLLKVTTQSRSADRDEILGCDYLTKSLCIRCCRRLSEIATWADFRRHRRLTEDCDLDHEPAKKACTRVTNAPDKDLAAALGSYLPGEQLDGSNIQWSLRASDATIIKRAGQTAAANGQDQDTPASRAAFRRALRESALLASQPLSELMSCQDRVYAAVAASELQAPETTREQRRQRAAALEGEIAMGLYSTALTRVSPILANLQKAERYNLELGSRIQERVLKELTDAIRLYRPKHGEEREPLWSRIGGPAATPRQIRRLRDSFLEKCEQYDALIKGVRTLLEISNSASDARRPVLEPVKALTTIELGLSLSWDHVTPPNLLAIRGELSQSIRLLEAEPNRLSAEPLGTQPNPMTCAWANEAIRRQIASAWIADALEQDRAARAELDAVLPELTAARARCGIGWSVSDLVEKDPELSTERLRTEARELLKKAGH